MSAVSLMNQRITVATRTGYDGEGAEVFGGNTVVQARVQQTSRRKLLPNGSVITIDAIVYVPPETTIETNDKVTYSSVAYKVLSKYTAVDGSGNADHLKLELVKWQV